MASVVLLCKQCSKNYSVVPCKKDTSKFCSKKCKWEFHGWSGEPNTECTQCKKQFHIKESMKKRFKRTHGYFCTNTCHAIFKSKTLIGERNPNYKGKLSNSDGYAVKVNVGAAQRVNGHIGMTEHQAVCCESLMVDRIGGGLHVHHRDCDIRNNTPENLAIMFISDHKWLHKEYGSASLWAMMKGKLTADEMAKWSTDRDRALRLLRLCVLDQSADDHGFQVVGGRLSAIKEVSEDKRMVRAKQKEERLKQRLEFF